MVEQVKFENESINLKIYKKRIENREAVSKRIKKIFPKLSKEYKEFVNRRRKELYLID